MTALRDDVARAIHNAEQRCKVHDSEANAHWDFDRVKDANWAVRPPECLTDAFLAADAAIATVLAHLAAQAERELVEARAEADSVPSWKQDLKSHWYRVEGEMARRRSWLRDSARLEGDE